MSKQKKLVNYLYIIRDLGLPTPVLVIDCEDVSKLTANKRDKILMNNLNIPVKNHKEVMSKMFDRNTVKFGDFREIATDDYTIHTKECAVRCDSMACEVWNACMTPDVLNATIKIPVENETEANRPPELHHDWQQRLFTYMAEQHNLVLVQSEMSDIKACILKEFYPQTM